MTVTVISFLAYSTTVDAFSYAILNGKLLLPNAVWVMLIFGLVPLVALTSIGLTVIVSGKVKGFREAQQISALLLLPVLALVFGQVSGAITVGPALIVVLMGAFGVISLIVFRLGLRIFKREEILSKLA